MCRRLRVHLGRVPGRVHLVLLGLILASLAPTVAVACFWDYDTLRDERRGMPGIAEVLAGQWERHSDFFYRHRVEAMKALLAKRPDDWEAIDNLAVAEEKLGERDAAIAVLLDKEKRHPGQYTTYANLGTVYIHQGNLDEGIACIKKALEINPDAHFGREEYQLQLAEFLKRAAVDPELRDDDFLDVRKREFRQPGGSYLFGDDGKPMMDDIPILGRPGKFAALGIKPNVFDGIVGMIRFGTGQSADLFFALGDLLAVRGDKNLAYRAYQRALDLNYPRPQVVRHAMAIVKDGEVPKAGFDPAVISAERASAEKWVADYQGFEDGLIRAGKSTDDESNYAPFYATHLRTLTTRDIFVSDYWSIYGTDAASYGGLAFVVAFIVWLSRRRRIARSLKAGGDGTVIAAP